MNTITTRIQSPCVILEFLTSPPAAALLDNSLFGCVNQNVDNSLKLSNELRWMCYSQCEHLTEIVK